MIQLAYDWFSNQQRCQQQDHIQSFAVASLVLPLQYRRIENWADSALTLSKILKPTSSTMNWYRVLANSSNNLDTATYHWCDSREIFEAHVKEFLWHFSTDILTIVETSSPYKCLIWGRIKKDCVMLHKLGELVRIYGPSGMKGGGRRGGVTDIASLKAVKTFASSIQQSRLGGRECKLCWTKLSEGGNYARLHGQGRCSN